MACMRTTMPTFRFGTYCLARFVIPKSGMNGADSATARIAWQKCWPARTSMPVLTPPRTWRRHDSGVDLILDIDMTVKPRGQAYAAGEVLRRLQAPIDH